MACAGVFFAILGASSASIAAASLSPLVVDWGRYLSVQSQATEKNGRTVVSGTVRNVAEWSARRIQLLIEGLGPDGAVVTQRVVWLGSDLTPGSHAYFETPVTPAAASYRVSVFAFDSAKRD